MAVLKLVKDPFLLQIFYKNNIKKICRFDPMICNKDTAKKTAKLLLSINAVKLQPQEPFTWASGWQSPIYCDNRILLSYPDVRLFIKDAFVKHIQDNYPDVAVIAGVATGAIAIAALVADALNLPFVYVRPKPKAHGRQNQIEGYLHAGQKVLVIEDLISTGMSSMQAVKALETAQADVLGMYAVFTYNFAQSKELFLKANLKTHTLSNYPILLEEASIEGFISESERHILESWRQHPSTWHFPLK